MPTRPTKRGKNRESQSKDKLFNKLSSEKDDDVVYMYYSSQDKLDKLDTSEMQNDTHFNLTPDKYRLVGDALYPSYEVGGKNESGYIYTVAVRGFNETKRVKHKDDIGDDNKEPLILEEGTGELMVSDPSYIEIVKTEPIHDFAIQGNKQNKDYKYNLSYEIREDDNVFPPRGMLAPKPLEPITTEGLSSDEILKVVFDFIEKDKEQGSVANSYSFILQDSSNADIASRISIENINEEGTGGSIFLNRFSDRFKKSQNKLTMPYDKEKISDLLNKIDKPYEFSQSEVENEMRFRELLEVFERTGKEYIKLLDIDMKEKNENARKKLNDTLKERKTKNNDNDREEAWMISDEIKELLAEGRPKFERGIMSPLPIVTMEDMENNEDNSLETSESLSAKDYFERAVRMEHAQMGKAFKGRRNSL